MEEVRLRTTARTRRLHRRLTAPVILLALTGMSAGLVAAGPAEAASAPRPDASSTTFEASARRSQTNVIIRARPGELKAVIARTTRLNGQISRLLPVINGLAATVPVSAVARLRADTRVLSVTPNTSGRMQSVEALPDHETSDTGSLSEINTLVNARSMWSAGYTGKGVDVALIDTGVAPVAGLTGGNVVNGPDLSIDQASADLRYKDSYGHGTHMASIITGRDAVSTPAGYAADTTGYLGVAPDSRVINLKVGATDGAADVSQVIAAIGWVTQHAHDPGLNIRVLNLSYGTASTQDYELDPLTYAVEAAWRKGIVVMVAAGNDGTDKQELANPAQDPNIIAVGAEDPNGTLVALDDTIPDFSNRGTNKRHVDIAAPGTHVLGLRVPGSVVDQENPNAAVGTRYLRGSGTSQATAVTSGVAALLLQARPELTPDQVKWAISESATALPLGTQKNRGAGLINATGALAATTSSKFLSTTATLTKQAKFGTGTGSLELARGSSHLVAGPSAASEQELTGEQDIFGTAWTGRAWAPTALAAQSWAAGTWRHNVWTGSAFDAQGNWGNATWTAPSWTGGTWSGRSWVGRSWVSGAWVGSAWVNNSWSGRSWVSNTWSSNGWN